jgi:hypothetical protein
LTAALTHGTVMALGHTTKQGSASIPQYRVLRSAVAVLPFPISMAISPLPPFWAKNTRPAFCTGFSTRSQRRDPTAARYLASMLCISPRALVFVLRLRFVFASCVLCCVCVPRSAFFVVLASFSQALEQLAQATRREGKPIEKK